MFWWLRKETDKMRPLYHFRRDAPFVNVYVPEDLMKTNGAEVLTLHKINFYSRTTHKDIYLEVCHRQGIDPMRWVMLTKHGRMAVRYSSLNLVSTDFVLLKRDKSGGPSDDDAKRWTYELAAWLLPYVESVEEFVHGRLRVLLSHIDKTSSGGQQILEAVNSVMSMEIGAVWEMYFPNQDPGLMMNLNETGVRWPAIKDELARLLPTESVMSPEETLRKMSKKKGENLLEFVRRYRRHGDQYIANQLISPTRATHLLFKKMPRMFQRMLCITDFHASSLDFIQARVANWLDWMRLVPPETFNLKEEVGDFMDVDWVDCARAELTQSEDAGHTECHGIRDRIIVDGAIKYDEIKNANGLMVAWKSLMSIPRYRAEAEKFMRSQRQPAGPSRANLEILSDDRSLAAEGQSTENSEECHAASTGKPSMHVSTWICGVKVEALVDTGASASFIQSGILKKLNLGGRMKASSREVTYGNGVVDRISGELNVPVVVNNEQFDVTFYCIDGRGPPLILGWPFLESNGFDICCKKKRLIRESEPDVQCHATEMQKNFQDLTMEPAPSQVQSGCWNQ